MSRSLIALTVTMTTLGVGMAAPPAFARPVASSDGGTFATLAAFRASDSFNLPAYSTVRVPVLGVHGVPDSGVGAVSVTLTAAYATRGGYLTAWADGTARPLASNLNFPAHREVANSAVVPVGANGRIAVYSGTAGTARVIVDVVGYYRSGAASTPGALTTQTAVRKLDTRTSRGGSQPGANGTVTVDVGITNASVLLNLAAVAPTVAGHLTVHDHGSPVPGTSNLNFVAGQTMANQAVVPVGSSGKIDIENAAGAPTDVLVDVTGRFAAGTATAGGAFTSVPPARLLDTRTPGGGGRLGTYEERVVPAGGHGGVPASGVAALLVNVTATNPSVSGYYLNAWAYPSSYDGTRTSRLNYYVGANVADLMTVPTTTDGSFVISSVDPVDVVIDIVGYVLDGPGVTHGSISAVVGDSREGGTLSIYRGSQLVASTRTGQYGSAVVDGLTTDTGGYAVCLDPDDSDYEPVCSPYGSWTGSGPPTDFFEPVPVRNAGNAGVYLEPIDRTGQYFRVTGRVTDSNGNGIAGVGVTLAAAADPTSIVNTITTDSYGAYETGYYADGPTDFVVCFQPPDGSGYRPQCYDDAADSAHATPVRMVPGRTTRDIGAMLAPA